MLKKFMQKLTGRSIVLFGSGLAALILGLVLVGIGRHRAGSLDTQDMAARWSAKGDASQISCFFSRESGMTADSIINFEHALDKALEEASIVSESENANARLWADAYSATGRVAIQSNRASIEVQAVGIGGDFFLFHPLKLLSGSYFSGNDVMKDYVVLDEDAAWQLFGSNDIAGQIVTIRGIPHIVAGVIEREEGRLAKAAGLDSSVAYVSYETLSRYGTNYGLNTYEIVMPNPVSGYAKQYVSEHIGVAENEVEIVENSTRYRVSSLFKLLMQFGTRSMNGKAIIYPYWENIARGNEDILGLLLVFAVILFLYPTVLLLIVLIRAWKRRTWTARSVWLAIKDKLERLRERWWAVQKRWKEKTPKESKAPKKPKEPKVPKVPKKLKEPKAPKEPK
ncbi:MAG: ABC transporter permease [Lachnospiraceae bacterium]|nr:ABC transporter permease [Lachnospiraceae bacterium]MBD5511428.1 ABC transporter permease [Lachnospiraceae bacterium]